MPTLTAEQPSNVSAPSQQSGVTAQKGTYGQVLKSSALVGGSQFLNIGIGMIRTKAMAVMLGPAGFGLFGLYSSVANLAQTLAGMGVNSSGVRQIAAAVSTGDTKCVAETVLVLRRVSVLLGLVGAALLVLFSRQISILTFATDQHASAISWLSIAVFLTLISASQSALIQGMRRIADLAKIQVLGALFGTLCGIPLVYIFRERGVVPSLICVAAMTIVSSWWYSRKIATPAVTTSSFSTAAIRTEIAALLKLGFAFMASSLVTLGVAYAIRVIILHRIGFEAAGLYQSAWTLGGLYVGFILQAMAADFYPRLTASANDNAACNRLVNEQAQVGLLLAGPGVIASLTLAPLVIAIFFSAKFGAAVSILRWVCLGAMLQVISWPIGFIIIAKAKRGLFIGCEVAWGIVSIGLAALCIRYFGLVGSGIAFFGSYVFHAIMVYVVVNRISGFSWSRDNWTTGLISLSMVTLVFAGFYVLPFTYSVALGIVATLLNAVYSVRTLTSFLTPEQIPAPIRKLLAMFRLTSRYGDGVTEFS